MTSGWLGLDWGNVPAWAGSILTSCSITVAALAYRRNILDKEAEQAKDVYAVVDWRDPGHPDRGRKLRIRNGSESVVYSVQARPFGSDSVTTISELSAKSTYYLELPPLAADTLNKRFELTVPVAPVTLETSLVMVRSEEPFPLLLFRDAAGYWWSRDERARLRRTKPGSDVSKMSTTVSMLGLPLIHVTYDYATGKARLGRGRRGSDD